ncbi:MAG: terpene cyclase/mutase family protein [Planctomycetes bacterium]|nr:terpene cyclase/mutase family protein [Planctomycetota bacterium]
MNLNRTVSFTVCCMLLAFHFGQNSTVRAADPPKSTLDFKLATDVKAATDKALGYLKAVQDSDGAWQAGGKPHMAVTALVVKAFAQDSGYGPKHPIVQKGTDYVLHYLQADGGLYVPDEGHQNYETSASLMALASLKDPARLQVIQGAQEYLKKLQIDEGEGVEASNIFYGGAGYGKEKRPDLSNTQMMLEALQQSGLSADDPVYQKALVFVKRCQMLPGSNDQKFAANGDGGFIYTPANDGESKAGVEEVDGKSRLRTYGSMTYSGFKSMLYAKVSHDDPRVQQCVKWIKDTYTLDHNPNMPGAQSKQGLFYFYYVFARAMKAWGEETITDSHGAKHPWRQELCEKLLSLQIADGSWVNEADRWYEGSPHLVTAYAVLALQTASQE